ncbi:MAG TPA: DUF2336 domain-containing protein, partial [Azospirillaceae bacterium]|nr:DUF2336 domain-containing protein [Azospirillaceae bacterium]
MQDETPSDALSGTTPLSARALLAYQKAKDRAADPDPAVRAALAAQVDVRPELLYYLADDDAPEVRRAVASNDATPVRAASRLARDPDEQVRAFLAGKLARALPGLQPAEHAALRDLALHALELLAVDQAVRVRAALASAIADVDCAPPKLAAMLARDMAREVAEPILRYCATLTDEELLDIVSAQQVPWVLAAVARRRRVPAAVADAVLAAGDGPASTALVANPGAEVPKARLAALPPDLAARLSGFVDEALRWALAERPDFDREAKAEIGAVVRRRLDWARDYVKREQPEMRAARLYDAGALTEDSVWDALS